MPANRTPGGFTGPEDSRINHGGPFGRLPLGFAKLLREGLKEGEELRDFALAVLRADVKALLPVVDKKLLNGRKLTKAQLVSATVPSIRDRIEMWKALKAASYGKDLPIIPDEGDAQTLTEEELVAAMIDSFHGNPRMLEFTQKRLLALQQAEGKVQ